MRRLHHVRLVREARLGRAARCLQLQLECRGLSLELLSRRSNVLVLQVASRVFGRTPRPLDRVADPNLEGILLVFVKVLNQWEESREQLALRLIACARGSIVVGTEDRLRVPLIRARRTGHAVVRVSPVIVRPHRASSATAPRHRSGGAQRSLRKQPSLGAVGFTMFHVHTADDPHISDDRVRPTMLLPGGSPELQPISVVTGGHTGLGLAIARELIECGSHVVLTSRRAQAATGTAAALRRMLASETKDDVKVVSAYPHST